MRWLDLLHAKLNNDGKFFSQGWGDEGLLKESLIIRAAPGPVSVVSEPTTAEESFLLRFLSPRANSLPAESKTACALLVLPPDWSHDTPVCLQLAATGDEGFEDRKRLVAAPLTTAGIGSLILENPFYGQRRPHNQVGTYLNTVSDLWAMGLAIVAESRALLSWLGNEGFTNLGVCGVSMGGAMASQVAALTRRPLAVCSCVAPHCATPVFLDGVLSNYVDWQALGPNGRERLGRQLDGSDLRLFPAPYRPDCTIWLAARKDAYVHPESSGVTVQAWPGSQIRWLNNGHVGTSLFHRSDYLRAVMDSFKLLTGTGYEFGTWLP